MGLTAPRNVAYPSAAARRPSSFFMAGLHLQGSCRFFFSIETVLYVQQARFYFASEYCGVCLGALGAGEPAGIVSPICDGSVLLLRVT